jgi:carbamoyltransferase
VPVFENLITLDSSNGLAFRSRYRSDLFPLYLERNLRGHRFDAVAGSLQKHTEALLTALVSNAIHVTGVRRVGLAGGVFMNVKANMLVAQMPEVEDLFIFPSCGDESTAIGSAYWAYFHTQGHRPAPLLNLYLGPAYDDEVSQFMEVQKRDEKYQVKKPDCIEERVADLLAQGKVVARFKGRMEWGARALGNRSILAHPSNPDIIRVINEQVKNRDFWMPFAPSILEERAHDYIVNSKNIPAPYMILAFESTELARRELRAAMHPYDYTLRPQIVKQEWNPSYHRLLKAFEERTGIGGILNTSFNLHGEPIVCTPADAFRVFDCSGLEYLAIGEYLIRKA